VKPSKEWLIEVKCSSEAIQILSPSTALPCSLRGTNIEALHNPIVCVLIILLKQFSTDFRHHEANNVAAQEKRHRGGV
jgi:hypothetical protein